MRICNRIAPGLREGSTIQEGDVIGQTGATGNASKIRANEAHLHFETRTRPHPGRGLDFREDPARQTQGLSVRPQDNRSNRQGGLAMTRSGLTGLSYLVLLATLDVVTPNTVAAESANSLPPLPRIFGDVTWLSTQDSLQKVYPGGLVSSTRYHGLKESHMAAVNVSHFLHPVFGQAHLALYRKEQEAASFIELSTSDEREECSAETRIPARSCRNAYNKELLRVFDRAKEVLLRELGPASVTKPSGGRPRSKLVRWDKKGLRITLDLDVEENEGWRVAVSATRLGAPL